MIAVNTEYFMWDIVSIVAVSLQTSEHTLLWSCDIVLYFQLSMDMQYDQGAGGTDDLNPGSHASDSGEILLLYMAC